METTKLKAKAILFDLDGTIVDSRGAYLEALRVAFKTAGQKVVDISVVTEIPKRLEQNLPIDDLLKGINVQKFLETYRNTYYKVTAIKAKPFPKISETLRQLSKRAKLALITMRHVPNDTVVGELERFDLAKHFQIIVTSLDTHDPKPSPDALIKCARQLGIETGECIVVGDSVADIKAGKNAGCKTVAVLSGIFSIEELRMEKPDLILESVNNLPDFLE